MSKANWHVSRWWRQVSMLKSVYTSLLIIPVRLKVVWQQLTIAVSCHTQDVQWILHLLEVWWPGARSARDNHLLACNSAKYSQLLIKVFTGRHRSKPFVMWLLIISLHLECLATLFCNLSLIACFPTLMFLLGDPGPHLIHRSLGFTR